MKVRIAVVLALAASFLLPVSAFATSVTCPSGTVLASGSTTQCTPTPSVITYTSGGSISVQYTCPSGYSLNGSTCQAASSSVAATRITTYSCNSGDGSPDVNHLCTLYGAVTTYSATATVSYSCASGTLVSGPSPYCNVQTSYAATNTQTTACPSGYTPINSNNCLNYNTGNWANPVTTNSYSCSSIYDTLSGSTCYKNSTASASPTTTYTCTSGDSLSGTTCYHAAPSTVYAALTSPSYSCSSGTLSGTQCLISGGTTAPSTTYSGNCPVYYQLNVLTGECDGVAFTPTLVSSPGLVTPYVCTTTNYDGSQTTDIYPYDASMNGTYVSRVCNAQTPTTGTTTNPGNYLCSTNTYDTNGNFNELNFTASSDLTSSTLNGGTYCTYTGDAPQASDPTPTIYQPLAGDPDPCLSTPTDLITWIYCAVNT